MLVIQIEVFVFTFVLFAFSALNHSANPLLWGIVGGVVFAVTHLVSVYLFDWLLGAALTGSVAPNGISILSRLIAIGIGLFCCFVVYQHWLTRSTPARRGA